MHKLDYRIDRSTTLGEYAILVMIDEETGKQNIELYDREPYPNLLASIFGHKEKPIRIRTIGPYADVEATVKKMIVEYELPYYQQYKAQTAEHYLDIDFAAELEKRQPKSQTQGQPPMTEADVVPDVIFVNDWQSGTGTEVITRTGKKVNLNSIKNLKQYQS